MFVAKMSENNGSDISAPSGGQSTASPETTIMVVPQP